ncbi:MAG: peptide chain release factor N(5)-glutamine methyltransferase [Chloroflexi bacterium]|nr:MAG: peptide chain release factor N(5)-glutamine methyltransferase [Chloroflexota bacterium]
MIISEALRQGTRLIKSSGSDEARLEAELLLMHALKTDRVHLYERLREEMPVRAGGYYRRLLDRRLAHEPTPYIVGHKEFFGLEFEVTRSALIPRPETETLVELAIGFSRDRYATGRCTIADVGAGSGVIAVALACELPNARVIATDVSKRALALARRNAARHGVAARIEFVEGDTLLPIEGRAEIIATNLPYVMTEDWLAAPPEIREREPRRALDGGADGLRYIRRLLRQAPEKLAGNGALFAEIGDRQGEIARSLAGECFPAAEVEVRPDLAGRDRVLCVYA